MTLYRSLAHAMTLLLLPVLAGCPKREPATHVPAPAGPTEPDRPVRVGLALGGGGSRGFAHVGVLRVLEQEKIPVHLIVGTSAGSLIGVLYADRPDSFELEARAWQVESEDIFDWSIIGSRRGPVTGHSLEQFVRAHVRAKSLDQLAIPFAAVATDLATGSAVVLDRGPIAIAIRASSAIPGVFRPVQVGGRTLVDGGLVEPVPVAIARGRGADVVVAVDLSGGVLPDIPDNLASISLKSISVLMRELSREKCRQADVVIVPEVSATSPFDFSRKKELMAAGIEAARGALPSIRSAIERARRARALSSAPPQSQ